MNELMKNAVVSDYNGFEQREFDLYGHRAYVISPNGEPNGRWIWRAEFLGAFDTVDVEMVRRGYTLVTYSISDMYGCDEAVELMKQFYDFCISELNLSEHTILFGFSRGGLYSANFALKYPSLVSALYLDAPVLDIKSWPGGLGVGVGSEHNFKECLQIYGLDRSSVLSFKGNPADRLSELADNKIPVVLVAGAVDEDVPLSENGALLASVYEMTDVPFLYIVKENCAHHPHSVDDPTDICMFLETVAL